MFTIITYKERELPRVKKYGVSSREGKVMHDFSDGGVRVIKFVSGVVDKLYGSVKTGGYRSDEFQRAREIFTRSYRGK